MKLWKKKKKKRKGRGEVNIRNYFYLAVKYATLWTGPPMSAEVGASCQASDL